MCVETSGKKRKASASKNSSGDKSQLEGAAEAEDSQQVTTTHTSCLYVYKHLYEHGKVDCKTIMFEMKSKWTKCSFFCMFYFNTLKFYYGVG